MSWIWLFIGTHITCLGVGGAVGFALGKCSETVIHKVV